MRKPRHRQSLLDSPLAPLLAAEASVRILRILCREQTAWPVAELAREAGLTGPGARLAIAGAIRNGIAERLGANRGARVRLRLRHPLAAPLTALFEAERQWSREVHEQLRRLFNDLDHRPMAAWVAHIDDAAWPPTLELEVLDEAATVDHIRDRTSEALGKLERDLDVVVDLQPLTRADLELLPEQERKQLGQARPIFGPNPQVFLESWRAQHSGQRHHREHDDRALERGKAIAAAIAADPTAIDKASSFVAARLRNASPQEQRELREWRRILQLRSVTAVQRVLRDPGERGTRLRQTSPFVGSVIRVPDADTLRRKPVRRKRAKP